MMHARKALRLSAGLLSALALSLSGCGSEPAPPAEQAAATPPPDEAQLPQEEPQQAPPPVAPSVPQVDEFVQGQELPDGFPNDLPLPPDARYVGSLTDRGKAARWTFPIEATELSEQLRKLYDANGWQQQTIRENGAELVVLASQGDRQVIAAVKPGPEGGSWLEVFLVEPEGAGTR